MIDCAVVVTLFADLSEAKDSIAAMDDCPDRDASKIYALNDEVFTEGAEGDICTFRAELLNLLEGKKTNLAVPLARVGVTLDAPLGNQVSFGYLIFLRSFFIASAYNTYMITRRQERYGLITNLDALKINENEFQLFLDDFKAYVKDTIQTKDYENERKKELAKVESDGTNT